MYSPVSTPAILDDSIDSPHHFQSDIHNQPLVDGFSRRLTYLRLSITDFCNFQCEYCLPMGYQGKRPQN